MISRFQDDLDIVIPAMRTIGNILSSKSNFISKRIMQWSFIHAFRFGEYPEIDSGFAPDSVAIGD